MFGFFNNKNTEDIKRQEFLKMRDELSKSFYDKDKIIIKELRKYEFLIETLYKTKNINEIKACYGQIDEDYTNVELIKELGIFNKNEQEKLIKWSNKYNELINNRRQIIEEYNKQIKELEENR